MYLADRAERDERIWVLDGDLADSDGAIHFAERHPDRFIMAGIAEQGMVSMSAGMASCGLRPWVFSFAAFLCYRAYDQIRVGLSQARQPVTLVGSHSGGCSGRNGKTHAAPNDIALMASLPGMQVWAPSDAADAHFAIDAVAGDDRPAYIRLPRSPMEDLGGSPALCRWIGAPSEIAIVSTGFATHLACEVTKMLAALGTRAGVLHCLRVSPLPVEILLEELRGVERIYVIEDHYRFGGLASLLRELELPVPIRAFGWPDDWSGKSGADRDLLAAQGLAPEQIVAGIRAESPRSIRGDVHYHQDGVR
jgi:transketolase